MFLTALSFPIDYQAFHDFLVANVPNADGLCDAHSDDGTLGYLVIEKNPLTETEQTAVQTYYNGLTQAGELAKSQPSLAQRIQASISLAAAYGSNLSVEYATSNVLQGITQAGKTQIVADYLRNLAYYLSNGSLYAAIAEINLLIADTTDAKTAVAPYVTNSILYIYLNKIQTYLQIPLTPIP